MYVTWAICHHFFSLLDSFNYSFYFIVYMGGLSLPSENLYSDVHY